MPQKPLPGDQCAPVKNGSGKEGYVRLRTDITPRMKTALVREAARRGVSCTEVVRQALARELSA